MKIRLPNSPDRYDREDQDRLRRALEAAFESNKLDILGGGTGPLSILSGGAAFALGIGVINWSSADFGLTETPTGQLNVIISANVSRVGHVHDAADVTTGVFARARLPAALAYEDEANTFTLLQTFNAGISIPDGVSITFAANVTGGGLAMGNKDITGINSLQINDPGPNEGIAWTNGNLWKIYESPNDLVTNSLGNLQIVQSTTRRATFNTSGQLEIPIAIGTSPFLITSTTLVANLNADLLDSQDGSFYQNASNLNAGNLAYARLPTGGGTWANGGTLSITGGITTLAGIVSSADITAQTKVIIGTDPGDTEALRIGGAAHLNLSGTVSYPTPGTGKTGVALYFERPTTASDSSGIGWGGQNATDETVQAGIFVQSDGAFGTKMRFATTNLYATGAQARWQISTLGHFLAEVDNTIDIGASAATRPRTLYLGTSALIGTIASGGLRAYYGASDGITTASDVRASSTNNLILSSAAGGDMFLNFDHGNLIRISGTGVRFETDNSIDIGAVGANRPRDLFLGRALTMGGDLTVSAGIVRLADPADLSLASTTHAFQIGATAGQNLAMDSNEIMARNNGVAATLNINIEGGNLAIGGILLPAAANGGGLGSAALPFASSDVNTMRVRDTSGNIRASISDSGGSTGFELGRQDGTGGTAAFIDFHSGATVVDYDARINVTGGSGSVAGGTLDFIGATVRYQSTSGNTRLTLTDTQVTSTVPIAISGLLTLGAGTTAKILIDGTDATLASGEIGIAENVGELWIGARSLVRLLMDDDNNGTGTVWIGKGTQAAPVTLAQFNNSGSLVFSTAATKIVPGATSISLRNNVDGADNLIITDAGIATLRNDLIIGTLGQFDSTDAPLDGHILFYHGGATNKWQAESFQLIYNAGDAAVAVNADSTSVQYLYLDPGAAADSPVGAPPVPVLKLFPYHKGVTVVAYASTGPDIEYHDGASFPADFRHIIYEYSLDNFGTAAKTLATASGDKVNHGRLTSGTLYYYRARAVDRAGNVSANSTVVSFTATANSDTSNFGIILATEIAVDRLAAISANIGIITAGQLRNTGNTAGVNLGGAGGIPGTWTSGINFEAAAGSGSMTRYVNFTATGANPFIKHELLSLNADGSATFGGRLFVGNPVITVNGVYHQITTNFTPGTAGSSFTHVWLASNFNIGAGDITDYINLDIGGQAYFNEVVTNAYQLRVNDVGGGSNTTNAYGVYIQAIQGGVNSWALYTNAGKVQFGDMVTIVGNGANVGLLASSDGIIDIGNTASNRFRDLNLGRHANVAGNIVMSTAASRLIPGATSFSHRNNANSADNILIADAGAITFRAGLSGITTLSLSGAQSGGTTLSLAGPITLTTAASKIVPGATSISLRNNADSADNLLIVDAGDATFRTKITLPGPLVLTTAASKIVPGATSLSLRNNADSADNLILVDAGDATFRTKITLPGPLVLTTGASKIVPGATSLALRNNADSANNLLIVDAGDATFRTFIDMNEMAAPATPAANTTRDYAKDVSAVSTRFWKDDAGVEHPHNLTLIDTQTYTANGTWTKPSGAVLVLVEVIGGGGGGGGGRGGAVNTARNGGGGGGGGARTQRWWKASELGATETFVVGAGGTAGTGGSAADGTDGGAGGDSSFGTTAIQWAFGGGGGFRGNAVTNGNTGGSGGGAMSAGLVGSTVTVLGGAPRSSVAGDGEGYGGASADGGGAHGRPAAWGGASGGGGSSWSGGVGAYSGGGGGGGGDVTSANVQHGGGDGGGVGSGVIQGGGGGGAGGGPNAGAAGANGDSKFSGKGGGGGGGNSNSAGPNGGAGGAGGTAGGGGGGGGGGTTVGAGGAGGAGGRGEVRVYTYA